MRARIRRVSRYGEDSVTSRAQRTKKQMGKSETFLLKVVSGPTKNVVFIVILLSPGLMTYDIL